ncbi:MAG: peroxiredoxin family protein [Chitinophagaceae bacterium]
MKNLLLLVLLILSYTYNSSAQNYSKKDAKKIISKSVDAIKKINSIIYRIENSNKSFSSEDTSILEGYCSLLKVNKDPIGNYHRLQANWISKGKTSTVVQLYDGKKISRGSINNNSIERNTIYNVATDGYNAINGNQLRDLLYNNAFDVGFMKQLTSIIGRFFIENCIMIDTMYKDVECFKITYKMKNMRGEDAIQDSYHQYIVSKETYLPIAYIFYGNFKKMPLYESTVVDYISINQITDPNIFTVTENNSDNTTVVITDNHTQKPVSIQNIYNSFDSNTMLSIVGSNINYLHALKGNIIVLDFWYLSCPPCLKLMPKINEIHNEFKDKNVVVIGINDIDDSASIKKFHSLHQYQYATTYRSSIHFANMFGINSFPTTIIIDHEGNVVKTFTGNYNNVSNEIKKSIQSLLKKQ